MSGHRLVLRGAEGNALVATVFGHGAPPVVLLHGGGQTRQAFAGTAQRLAEAGFTAIAVDQRGHGDSEWVASGAYGFSDYAADALAISAAIAGREGARPVAVGASLGGLAALLALGREPHAFAGLVLVDVTPRLDPDGVDRVLGFMRSHAKEGFASVQEAADVVAAYLPHRPRPKSLEGLKKNLRHDPDGRWRWHWDPRFMDERPDAAADRFRTQDALIGAAQGLDVPSLLVRGRSSELVRAEHAREFLSWAKGSELVDIAEARHMVAGDRNDVFTQAVVEFLNRRFHGVRSVPA